MDKVLLPHEKLGMICVGAVAGAHGIRGHVKVKSFTQNPMNLFEFEHIYIEKKNIQYHFVAYSNKKSDLFIAQIREITTREEAETWKGQKIFVEKIQLPSLEENEFYFRDLIGLDVIDDSDKHRGGVLSVQNYGAGDVLEVSVLECTNTYLIPFTSEMVPLVNIDQNYIKVDQALFDSYIQGEA